MVSSNTRRQSLVAGIVLIFLILVGDFITGAISSHVPRGSSSPNVALGTWTNMPSAMTELMGNQSYRAVYDSDNPGGAITAELVNQCITPSNHAGAQLQLQYATYDLSTDSNSTNFVNFPSANVLIDNSAVYAPCPGINVSGYSINGINLPSTGAIIFRVVGSGGGGQGDNPRFSSVSISLVSFFANSLTIVATLPSTTGFLATVTSTVPVFSSQAVPFTWFAGQGSGVSLVVQHGTSSCTIASSGSTCGVTVTFPIAFASTPDVVVSTNVQPPSNNQFIGSLSLFSAETVTA